MTTVSDFRGSRPPRADAVRSRAAILESAVRLLERGPFSGLAEVAQEAGVTRQTVYAHFRSRGDLLAAVIEHLIGDYEAAIRAARLDEGSATEALVRLLSASRELNARGGPALANAASMTTAEESRIQHDPIMGILVDLLRRGQEGGEFDPDLPPHWLAAATVALGHAAAAEVGAGRLDPDDADRLVLDSLLRVYGAR